MSSEEPEDKSSVEEGTSVNSCRGDLVAVVGVCGQESIDTVAVVEDKLDELVSQREQRIRLYEWSTSVSDYLVYFTACSVGVLESVNLLIRGLLIDQDSSAASQAVDRTSEGIYWTIVAIPIFTTITDVILRHCASYARKGKDRIDSKLIGKIKLPQMSSAASPPEKSPTDSSSVQQIAIHIPNGFCRCCCFWHTQTHVQRGPVADQGEDLRLLKETKEQLSRIPAKCFYATRLALTVLAVLNFSAGLVARLAVDNSEAMSDSSKTTADIVLHFVVTAVPIFTAIIYKIAARCSGEATAMIDNLDEQMKLLEQRSLSLSPT